MRSIEHEPFLKTNSFTEVLTMAIRMVYRRIHWVPTPTYLPCCALTCHCRFGIDSVFHFFWLCLESQKNHTLWSFVFKYYGPYWAHKKFEKYASLELWMKQCFLYVLCQRTYLPPVESVRNLPATYLPFPSFSSLHLFLMAHLLLILFYDISYIYTVGFTIFWPVFEHVQWIFCTYFSPFWFFFLISLDTLFEGTSYLHHHYAYIGT